MRRLRDHASPLAPLRLSFWISAEHHYKLLINMQNKLRRSEARLLSGAYRKVSASNAVFCASKVRIKCCWTKGLPLEDWCLHRCLLVVSMLVYRVQQPPNTYRCSQAIKAHDFDSCIRWFESTQRQHMRW